MRLKTHQTYRLDTPAILAHFVAFVFELDLNDTLKNIKYSLIPCLLVES